MDIELARAIPFLRNLTEDELGTFAALLDVRECQQGELLLEEGTKPSSFTIICEGVVHVRRRGNNRSIFVTRIGPGGFFGEINLFDPGVATASLTAMTKCRLAVISYDQFRDYMDAHPRAGYRIASALLAEVCRRLRDLSHRLTKQILWSGENNRVTAPPQ